MNHVFRYNFSCSCFLQLKRYFLSENEKLWFDLVLKLKDFPFFLEGSVSALSTPLQNLNRPSFGNNCCLFASKYLCESLLDALEDMSV